jgi:hypothetical protein
MVLCANPTWPPATVDRVYGVGLCMVLLCCVQTLSGTLQPITSARRGRATGDHTPIFKVLAQGEIEIEICIKAAKRYVGDHAPHTITHSKHSSCEDCLHEKTST